MSESYEQAYARWRRDPEAFWAGAAEEIDWFRRWDRVLDYDRPPFARWFVGAETNTCFNAVDRQVAAGNGERTALVYDSPMTGTVRRISYRELQDTVARAAGMLRKLGVAKGDRVLVYMPMVPEAAVAMLACARIGAVHSVVFGGFAPRELATRIDDARPNVILSASCGLEPGRVIPYLPLIEGAIALASHKPRSVVVLQREMERAELKPGRDHDWAEALAAAQPADVVPVKATDPLYVLYTSGTTGKPKGVVRDNGGHLVALKWSMPNIFGVAPGETFWAASDVGWVVGHSYIVYAPLFHGATAILYEGKPVGTPDAGAYWRVISQHGAVALFTAPTAFRAIKKEDSKGEHVARYDLSRFRTLFLAGERADPDTVQWAEGLLKRPVVDHWWQTETGWPMAANFAGLGLFPTKHGSCGKPVPGYDLRVVDANCEELPRGETGAIVAKLPLPPGSLPTLWNNDQGFVESYMSEFPGFYKTADAGFMDEDGYLHVMSRTDDIINVAGHRLSTGGMEEILSRHPDVAECAVIGAADQLKGQLPVGFVVLKSGVARKAEDIAAELVQMVRQQLGPVAAFKTCTVVQRLPKTRSGKILRGSMRRIADGQDYVAPATIDDPAILGEIEAALREAGYGRKT